MERRRQGKRGFAVILCCCLGALLLLVCLLVITLMVSPSSSNYARNTIRPFSRKVFPITPISKPYEEKEGGRDEGGEYDMKMVFLDETELEPESELELEPEDFALAWANLGNSNMFLKFLCLLGVGLSVLVLMGEQFHWFPNSFQRFSVATKIPIEIFCVTGPVVLLSAVIYTIMLVLLLMDSNTSSVFFLSASWTAILMDMTLICYDEVVDLTKSKDDLAMHAINLLIVYFAFARLRFVPYTFILCGLFFWISVTVLRRKRQGANPYLVPEPAARSGSP
ncbi:hypothetical protein BASA81_002693 [Batrachochytrium salamandrivorans]|nr:hypothetical protein BASA81_002693 [Batrachochytrium salamandrivorans]